MTSIFRYSGNKTRLLKYLPPPPTGTKRIVEPFAGSAAYSMHHLPHEVVLAESNSDVRALWSWLVCKATEDDLFGLQELHPASGKVDVRTLGLHKPQETLLRLMVSGAYVGQLSSWVLYPQHRLNLQPLAQALPYIKSAVKNVFTDFRHVTPKDGDCVFIDPPYLGTQGNYQDKTRKQDQTGGVSAQDVREFVQGLTCPAILTYGDGAPELFPEFVWRHAVTRKVPILRGGGVKLREEWYSLHNWPEAA